MSSETTTTTTAAEEIPDTTTVAPEQETNVSGDQDATVIAAVENDAVMEDKPLATPDEIETAKTSESATVPTDVAAAEEEASRGDEVKPKDESTEKIATVPANGADGDTDQEQKQEGGEGAIIASDADDDKKDGNTNDVEADGEPATTNEVVDKVRESASRPSWPVMALHVTRWFEWKVSTSISFSATCAICLLPCLCVHSSRPTSFRRGRSRRSERPLPRRMSPTRRSRRQRTSNSTERQRQRSPRAWSRRRPLPSRRARDCARAVV